MNNRPANQLRYVLGTAAIIVAALSLYLLGGMRVNLWDRDEAWYCQSSRQMADSGDWVIPHFLDQTRSAKPIFTYWCQAASMKLVGHRSLELAARLPSAIAMTLTMAVLATVIGSRLGWRRAMYTVLVFGTSAMVIMSAKMCLTDSIMMLFVTIAQLCVFAVYRQSVRPAGRALPRWIPVVLWVSVGLAGLTKGPVVLILLLSTLVALAAMDNWGGWKSWAGWRAAWGWWGKLRPKLGLWIVPAIVLPWLAMAMWRNPSFIKEMLLQPGKHLSSNQDGQWKYPGYYLVAIWPTFFPWCLLLVTGLVLGWKHRRTPHVRFALATIVGNLVYAEAMVTKLPHYMLPSFSALAFLTATALIRCMRRQHDDLHRPMAVIATAIWAFATIGATIMPWLPAGLWGLAIPWKAALAFTLVGAIYSLGVVLLFAFHRLTAAAVTLGLGFLVVLSILFAFYFPNAMYLRVPSQVGQRLQAMGAVGEKQVIMVGYAEPSLAFYQGGTIRQAAKNYLETEPAGNWPKWIVTTARRYNGLSKEKQALLQEINRFKGLNYNGGDKTVDSDKVVEVLILRNRALDGNK